MKMKKSHWIFLAVVAVVAIYYYLIPIESHPYLALGCPLKELTGLDCPLCGGQRAFHALLHCEFGKALSYNYFLVIAVPYMLLLMYAGMSKSKFACKLDKYVSNNYVFFSFFALAIIWMVVRNLL